MECCKPAGKEAPSDERINAIKQSDAINCNGDVKGGIVTPSGSEEPDAKPSRDPSEVDAKPISWPRSRGAGESLTVPSNRDSLCYDLSGTKRVIIFNQKTFSSRLKLNPRNGTEVDVRAIQNTFKSLNWEVELYNDSTVSQIRDIILKKVQLCEDDLAAISIFILSHGEDNGTVFAADYPFRVDHDILAQLTAEKCPGLAGRPKLIFVQACQGQETDQGVSVCDRRRRHTSQDSTSTYKIPNYADFLIFQASFWDHFSFRSSETGSWFVQALCNKIDKSSDCEPLFDILLTVSHSVALDKESNVPGRPNLDKKKQVPLLYSTMLRKMYLKAPATSDLKPADTPTNDSVAVTDAFADLQVQSRARTGSYKSLPGTKSSKDKEKDCQIM